MKVRVQRRDGLWEVVDLPSGGTEARDFDGETNCVFTGAVNLYFSQDGYFEGPGRSLESMTETHSEASALMRTEKIEREREFQDALDAEEVDEREIGGRTT